MTEPGQARASERLAHPRHWPAWAGLALLRLISLLPLPLIAVLGAGLGMLIYALYGSRRRVVQINIARCFPDLGARAQARLVRQHFRALGQAFLDIGIAWWGSAARLKRLVRWRGREHYEAALAAQRNIILLVPHSVGIEIGGIRLSIDMPLADIFRHPDNKVVRAVMERARTRFQARLIEHIRGLVPVIRALKAGFPLYYLPDQDPGRRSSSFVPFFGIPTATFNVLGRIAATADAVVIPCFIRQRRFGLGYEIVMRVALENFPTGDAIADTTRMNAEIEKFVREWPAQYFWVHKRFKTRPEGEPDFYPKRR
jgi:lipid A biosynthesis lauroyl/palmitoleoyl acyltransferase